MFFCFLFSLRLWECHPARVERMSLRILSAVGLGIYGDSNSESEEEQGEHAQIQNDDSDEELKVSGFCERNHITVWFKFAMTIMTVRLFYFTNEFHRKLWDDDSRRFGKLRKRSKRGSPRMRKGKSVRRSSTVISNRKIIPVILAAGSQVCFDRQHNHMWLLHN